METPTIVLTDHSATTSIAKQTKLTTSSTDKLNLCLVRASRYLSHFSLDIRHKPGRMDIVPDALSRLAQLQSTDSPRKDPSDVLEEIGSYDVGIYQISLMEMSDSFRRQIIDGYKKDNYLAKIFDSLSSYAKPQPAHGNTEQPPPIAAQTLEQTESSFEIERLGIMFAIRYGLLY